MNPLSIIAVPSLVVGLLMIFFRQWGGVAFCRLGKFVFAIFKPIPWVWSIVSEVYDPIKAPKRFLFLGSVFVAQAGFLVFLGSRLVG